MEVTGEKNKDGSQGSPAAARPPEDGGQAFPAVEYSENWSEYLGRYETKAEATPGMTLRDWFAGKALAGFCAAPDERAIRGGSPEEVEAQRRAWALADAQAAYRLADAMIAARAGG